MSATCVCMDFFTADVADGLTTSSRCHRCVCDTAGGKDFCRQHPSAVWPRFYSLVCVQLHRGRTVFNHQIVMAGSKMLLFLEARAICMKFRGVFAFVRKCW